MPAAATTDYAPIDYSPVMVAQQQQQQLQQQDKPLSQQAQLQDTSAAAAVCGYQSAPNLVDHEAFVRDAVHLMLEQAVFRGTDRRRPVLNWKSPEELRAVFDFQLDRSATTHGHLLRLIEGTIEHSVKTGHPYFINQLFSRYTTALKSRYGNRRFRDCELNILFVRVSASTLTA